MSDSIPTIKGIFIKSHIDALRREKGDGGVKLLEEKYGKPLNFKNTDNIPIRDEVTLIEYVVDILNPAQLTKEQRAFEAGKLHFKDFLTTPLARIIFPIFKNQFKMLMMQAHNIAGHVFQGVDFTSIDLGEKSVKVIMKNNEYPVEHFKGLFQAWMEYSGLEGAIEEHQIGNVYEYIMTWK